MTALLDQREIQKLGGKATRFPTSYIVVKILEKHDLMNRVLDVTYGRGRFWYYRRPKLLVGVDPRVWDWVVAPDIFIPRTVWAARAILKQLGIEFDVVVCDPPWNPGTNYNRRDEYSFAIGSPKIIIEESFRLARELGIRYLLLHYNRVLDSRRIVDNIEFRYVARYLNNPGMRTTFFTLYEV